MRTAGRPTAGLPERILERARAEAVEGLVECVLTARLPQNHGYAKLSWRDGDHVHAVLLHRAAWTALRGPIPGGMTIHHRCHVRLCVNVDHMELVPHAINARMNREALADPNELRPDRCVNGHGPEDWYPAPEPRHPGRHRCRKCTRIAVAKWEASRQCPATS